MAKKSKKNEFVKIHTLDNRHIKVSSKCKKCKSTNIMLLPYGSTICRHCGAFYG